MLQVDEALAGHFAVAVECVEVIVDGEADFDDGGVFEEVFKFFADAYFVQSEQEATLMGGNLHERHVVALTLAE